MTQSQSDILIIEPADGMGGESDDILRECLTLVEKAVGPLAALDSLQTNDRPSVLFERLLDDITDEAWGQPGTVPPFIDLDGRNDPPLLGGCVDPLETIMIRDPAMAALMRRVEHVAPSNATVLITGESGTGKELVAAHLHRSSGRHGGAFVALNCEAMSEGLLESELFGHERGAFFGAVSRRIGKFEAANGGTLLLDEIGAMDLRIQAKVLKAVEQRQINRVGGDSPVPVDVRIMATTNRNLQAEVRSGRFRADLLFRLNVISLRVPPLRERPADLPALADFFVRKFARANGRPANSISPNALAILQEHVWPGNVRELENVMHRAVLTETGPSIMPASLGIDTIEGTDTATTPLQIELQKAMPTAGRTIEAVEKEMILETLRQRMGSRSQAAAVLGISIRTLRNKLHVYERGGTRIPRPVVVGVA
jgi:two-component system response regulator FlrC